MSNTLESAVYSKEGKEVRTLTLPASVFDAPWNPDLVHQVVVSLRGNARAMTAHTKGRGDVRGGGKKPWKQKGTGRARHGSSRSPIWVGGGVALGPVNEKDYSRKLNRNMKAKALATVLSQKLRDDEVILVDSFDFTSPKAKDARAVLGALATTKGHERLRTKRVNAALILIPGRDVATELSFRNFGNVEVVNTQDVNPAQLLSYKYIVVAKPEDNVKVLSARVSTKNARKKEAAKATK